MDKEGQNRKRKEANERKGKMKPKGERKRKEVGLGAKKGILMDKKGKCKVGINPTHQPNVRWGLTQHTNQM